MSTIHANLAPLVQPIAHKLAKLSQSQYSCPSPLDMRPLHSLENSTRLAPLHPLIAASDEFVLELTYDQTVCNSFRLVITRTDPSMCTDNVTAADDVTAQYQRSRVGPDGFFLQIDGPEHLVFTTPTKYHASRCAYEFDVRLNAVGDVWLQVMHVSEQWGGFNEVPELEVPYMYNHLVQSPIHLDICNARCKRFIPTKLGYPSLNSIAQDDTLNNMALALPSCSGQDPVPGTFVPAPIVDLLYPPVQLPMVDTRPSAGFHSFVPSECQWDHAGLRFREHSRCTTIPHKTLFIGDSHTRAVYDAVSASTFDLCFWEMPGTCLHD